MDVLIPLGILASVLVEISYTILCIGLLNMGLKICNLLEMFGFVGFGSLYFSFLLLKENPKDICFLLILDIPTYKGFPLVVTFISDLFLIMNPHASSDERW